MQFAVKDGVRRAIIPGTLASSGLKAAGWVLDQDGDGAADDTTRSNLVGGREVVSADQAAGSHSILQNLTAVTGQYRHLIVSDCSGVRLVYSARVGGNGAVAGVLPEIDLSNIVYIQAGVATTSNATTFYPVTFAGKQTGELGPGMATLISDPIPLDLTAGSYLYERAHVFHGFGAATTLAASTSANATSFTTAALPNITSGNFVVDTGANQEVVEVVAVTGSGPYTCTINPNGTTGATRNKLVLAHSSGVAVYQQLYTDRVVYADRGEFGATYSSALTSVPMRAYSGSFSALATVSTTLSADVSAGATSFTAAAIILTPTLLIGSGGTQETVTVTNQLGTSAPYTYYVAAPLAYSQTSGAAIVSGTGYSGAGFCARLVVADRVTAATRKPTIVVVGDSISAGSNYNLRSSVGFIDLAFAATHPVVNLSTGGDLAAAFVTVANSIGRRKWLGLGGWLFLQFPHNDISTGRTLAQIQADLTTIINMGRARGMKICLATQKPRTTSSDGWATVGNQTADAYEAVRVAYNAWIRGGADGLADLVVDVGAPLDSGLAAGGVASGKWIAAGSSGPYTTDGVHPSANGHVLMAATINPALFT